jgi:hypothetical protein
MMSSRDDSLGEKMASARAFCEGRVFSLPVKGKNTLKNKKML